MLHRNVAEGVHRLEHAHVNRYLVEDDDGVAEPAVVHARAAGPA